jgi:lincosamide nucleotidyltransferase B/F
VPHALNLLNQIGARLARRPGSIALLGLGSAGRDTARFDEHSDLDFFVIAADKLALLADLSWLGDHVTWKHRNTVDGYKALVEGVFCEFAVFTQQELPGIPAQSGRIVWASRGFQAPAANVPHTPDVRWLTDEILSNLYVGLHRWLRGEHLAALRMIQGEAVDNLLRLRGAQDPFSPARRAESGGLDLSVMAGGYHATPEAAEAILRALGPLENPMARAVGELLARAQGGEGT